jgi:hypothetical protein
VIGLWTPTKPGILRTLALASLAIFAVVSCNETGVSPTASSRDDNYSSGISAFRGLGGKAFGGAIDFRCSVQDENGGPLEFSPTSTHPYFPLDVGYQWEYGGVRNGVPVNLLITVLDETRVINVGTTRDDEPVTFSFETRVVDERWTDQAQDLTRFAWNYFAQREDGAICLFGRDEYSFDDTGTVVDGDGFCGDPDLHLLPPPFEIGDTHLILDTFYQVIGSGPVRVPFGRVTETVRLRSYGLEPGKLDKDGASQVKFSGEMEEKIFASDIGLLFYDGLPLLNFTRNASAPPLPPLSDESSCALEEE